MENFVKFFLRNKTFTWLLLFLTVAGGIFAYMKMGKLEDAPFTIKQALVTTAYPGASPYEVQTQVTDVLEEAIQSLGELYYLKTENRAGLSKITVYVKKEIRAGEMQQLWDKLRRKVNDAQAKLPSGAKTSVVVDDFGDVLGVFYGICGEGKSNRELETVARNLKNEILKVDDVAKVELFGVQTPTIDILVSPGVMSRSGITAYDIAGTFERQNRIVDAGAMETGTNRIRIDTRGSFTSLEEIKEMVVTTSSGEYFKLEDIAEISESYETPARNMMKADNRPAVGIAVATVSDGNVVDMSANVAECISDFRKSMPEGFEIVKIYDQGHESYIANKGFIVNLTVSVITVVAVLLFFIGFKNGFLVGTGLVFSIFVSLIYMWSAGIALQRMSLAAIIIAMGMLVDNAIVVFDSSLVNMRRGMNKRNAILSSVKSTGLPLLAATAIAMLAFLPVYLSPHITGELLSSLFIVLAVSLSASWIFAVTQTPFFIQEFVRRPRAGELEGKLFDNKAYNTLRGILKYSIRHKWEISGMAVLLLIVSLAGFRAIPKKFTPQLDKQFFSVDMWLPEGTAIETTEEYACRMTEYIKSFEDAVQVSSYIGQTPPRYYLANASYGPQPNYAQCLVEAADPKKARELQRILSDEAGRKFPDVFVRINPFELSSIPQALIEARFCGDDPAVLDSLVGVALAVMHENPKAANPRNDWGNMAMCIRALYDPVKSGKTGVSRSSMMESVKSLNDGITVGIFRDSDKEVPVKLKTAGGKTDGIRELEDTYIWDGHNSAPLSQISGPVCIDWEWPLIRTYNRTLSMAAACDVTSGHTMSEVWNEIHEEIERIELPEGYSFFWDSQYKDQKEGMQALTKFFPLAFLLLTAILVALFGNCRQPLIILLILPFSSIGTVSGLLLTGCEFGFFTIAGWLGLLGMIVKNIIVLLDETNVQIRSGADSATAVVEATVSRAKPVIMAAGTTILGMVPLLFDVVFGSMAAAVVFGLAAATVLTLILTPVLFAVFYNVKPANLADIS